MRARSVSFVLAVSFFHFAPLVAHADDVDDKAAVLVQRPDDPKAYEDFGTAAIGARRYDDAIAKLKIGVARIPDFRRAYYLMAYAYRSKQAWADAAAYYRICIAVKQQENEAYFGLGKALAGMGDNPAAAVAFSAYIEREKDPAKARFVDGAKAELAKLTASAPVVAAGQVTAPAGAGNAVGASNAAALKLEADSLKNQGRFEEATVAYKRALAVDPNNQDLYNDLGNAYFGLKRYNDASQAFRDATSRDPNYAIGWYNLANALRKADRKGEAVEAYRRYMALQPNDPDPYFGMGQTLKGMGDTQGAIKAFHRYLEMETRPEQAKWQEKARQELQALEGSQHTQVPAQGGKVGFDEKSAGGLPDAPNTPAASDLAGDRDGLMPVDGNQMGGPGGRGDSIAPRQLRDLHDPFSGGDEGTSDVDGLMNPFDRNRSLPSTAPAPSTLQPGATSMQLRQYGNAVAAFRKALAAHIEKVSTRYERGVVSVMAGRGHDAIAAWNTIALDDSSVSQAKRDVMRARELSR